MYKKILVTGATGFIGKEIVKHLCGKGAYIKILTGDVKKAKSLFGRNCIVEFYYRYDYEDPDSLKNLLEDTYAVINLAGENVGNKRWTKKYKEKIYSSRIDTANLLTDAIKLCTKKPECFISMSGVGIYGFRGEEIVTEDSGFGNDFLAKLCIDWEQAALKSADNNLRVILLRTGIVLSGREGPLKELLSPFKFYSGAYLGSGKQYISWIHIEDLINIFSFILENTACYGAVNAVSPEPVTNKQFSSEIGKIKKTLLLLPVPSFMVRIIVGEFAKSLLTGQRVIPEKLLNDGFRFNYPDISSALINLIPKK